MNTCRPDGSRQSQRPSPKTLRLQRKVNEKLVIAAIRAQEEADFLRVAQVQSEEQADAMMHERDSLRATAELRERLIGIVGHDLRNPLSAVHMAGYLLLARGRLDAADARLASRVVASSKRMEGMIRQLTDFTRVRLGGGFVLTLERSNLGAVCHTIAEEVRIASAVTVAETVEGDVMGVWDRERLAEAISNLMGNAVDHAEPGSTVHVRAYDDGRGCAVDVTNRGPTIPSAILPSLFDPFHRANDALSGHRAHLGLGLYIAREIALAHGGTLGARSANGVTTFCLRLPRAAAIPGPQAQGSCRMT